MEERPINYARAAEEILVERLESGLERDICGDKMCILVLLSELMAILLVG